MREVPLLCLVLDCSVDFLVVCKPLPMYASRNCSMTISSNPPDGYADGIQTPIGSKTVAFADERICQSSSP